MLGDEKKIYLDNGKPLVYMPLELKLNLSDSPYKQTAGARVGKYEVDRTAYSDGRQVDNDIVLFRYGDALLMEAEAKVRNGEDGSRELNAIRDRVGMPHVEANLDNILKERLLELVWEGWRRQDLIRFGKYTQAYDQRTPLRRGVCRVYNGFPNTTKMSGFKQEIKTESKLLIELPSAFHSPEIIRKTHTNGCHIVAQISSNPDNRFILR